MILTINTPQIAPFKENIADPIGTAYGRFLSPVDAH
jgi:hypothetical protein